MSVFAGVISWRRNRCRRRDPQETYDTDAAGAEKGCEFHVAIADGGVRRLRAAYIFRDQHDCQTGQKGDTSSPGKEGIRFLDVFGDHRGDERKIRLDRWRMRR